METPHNATNTKEFEVTGVSRSGRVRKKSSKLLDFQSPDDVERKIYKKTTSTPIAGRGGPMKYIGRGRPSLAALKARKEARVATNGQSDMAADDEDLNEDVDEKDEDEDKMELDVPFNSDEEEDEDQDVLQNTSGLTVSDSDDGFGELVADLVGTEAANLESSTDNPKTQRQSLYMSEKNSKRMKETRLERKDKGKTHYTAYSMWAREHRKSNKFGIPTNLSKSMESLEAARRLSELWSNVSNKEKNVWRRKAKIQSTRAKQRERAGINITAKVSPIALNNNQNSFINRPTTSRTRKLAEDKQKAQDDLAESKPLSAAFTIKRTRNNSYRRNQNSAAINHNSSTPFHATINGESTSTYNNSSNNIKTPLPTIEPIDAAAHLKLLGESLSIIGDRLKEHEGQIAVSGSLSVLLDSLLCSLGPLLCLTARLPGLDKKPQLKANLATTLDNIAYVMPGL